MKHKSSDKLSPSSPSEIKNLCCGCGEAKPLIEAHIIPKAFCKRLSKLNAAAKLVTPNAYVRRSPTGYYDSNILCGECDGKLGVFDDYAFSLVQGAIRGKKTIFEPVHEQGRLVAHSVADFDFDKLRLFVLSVLWRASISEDEFCSGAVLNDKEKNCLRDIVLYGAPISDDEYPFYCGRIILNGRGGLIHPPHPQISEDVQFYNFCTGEFFFLVKVDCKPAPFLYSSWVAKPNQPLIFVLQSIEESPQLRAAVKAVKSGLTKN